MILFRLTELVSSMGKIFSGATVANFTHPTSQRLELEPGIAEVFRTSLDQEELKHYWVGFRNETGRKYRQMYME